jgi:tRNA A-37 threonylcarbamoyl transferase component Bud32/tetratricopeptide (TPR) repeat protein
MNEADSKMNPEPQREEALFQAAAQLTGSARAAFLDAMCEGDAALRAHIEALIAAHEQSEGVLAEPASPAKGTMKIEFTDVPDEAVGQKIGRYKILEKVGEGGCGVVYVTEQTEPVRRRVALKVIKLGMDTKQVVARFEAERQALAMMDQPNIAKVLDAGATDAGRPYFIMELVRGIRITDYCDQNKLPTRERLELFIKICQAIQHAHQKGIIHRDIKPSNILVTLHDGVPVPKVIDFGIAKATEGRLTDATVYTQLHQFIGTPAYMSPEQAEMSGLDIDTRSDIYSLGVLLYELLTGRTPFDATELMALDIDAMRKTIREKEPMRPSTKVATLQGEELSTTATRHAAEAPKLISQLCGDLDWIVMKCLEKDRTRRYETANGLAMDLKRHLSNETVVARPSSSAYRFQKLVRRNKLAFAAVGAVVGALVLGIIATTWQALRAKEAAEQARHAEAMALQSRGEAEKLSNFMLDDFYTELEPSGRFEMVARLARQALAYYDNLPATLRTPETERNRAMAQARLALITTRQGDVKAALSMASEAGATFDQMRENGDRSEQVIYGAGLALFAEVIGRFIQHDRMPGVSALQQGIELLRPLATSPKGSRRVKRLYAEFLNQLCGIEPPEQGVNTAEEALQVLAGLGALDPDWSHLTEASAYADIADTEAEELLDIGRLDDAKRLEEQTQSLAKGVLARRPGDLRAMLDIVSAETSLGQIAAEQFQDDQALQLIAEARRAAENYVRFNPSDGFGWFKLDLIHGYDAAISFRKGYITEALQKAREATEGQLDQPITPSRRDPTLSLVFGAEMAMWEAQRGNRAAAEKALQEIRLSVRAFFGSHKPSSELTALLEVALDSCASVIKMAFGENAEAEATARSALNRLERLERDDHNLAPIESIYILDWRDVTLENLVRADLNLGHYAEAESAARKLLSLSTNKSLSTYPPILMPLGDRAWAQVLLVQGEVGQSRKDEALKTIEPAIAEFRQRLAQGARDVLFRQRFARALYVQSLAEPPDAGGLVRRRDELNDAEKLLQGLTDEARQLHDSKELLSWISAEQKKLGTS